MAPERVWKATPHASCSPRLGQLGAEVTAQIWDSGDRMEIQGFLPQFELASSTGSSQAQGGPWCPNLRCPNSHF